jgi:ADP-ribose pyrophosphatase
MTPQARRVYAGRLLNVDLETVEAPDGSTLQLEMVRHPGAAAVVALVAPLESPDPNVLMLRQFRYAAGGAIWEVPAGVLEAGETPAECARRELKEETGADAERFEHLTTIYTTPGFTDERIHLFLATGVTAGEARPMEDEFLEVRAMPISRALELIRDGEIADSKSIVALLYLAGFRLGM